MVTSGVAWSQLHLRLLTVEHLFLGGLWFEDVSSGKFNLEFLEVKFSRTPRVFFLCIMMLNYLLKLRDLHQCHIYRYSRSKRVCCKIEQKETLSHNRIPNQKPSQDTLPGFYIKTCEVLP